MLQKIRLFCWVLLGGLMAVSGGVAIAYNIRPFFPLSGHPEKMTLAQAEKNLSGGGERWVRIQDGEWDCYSLVHYGSAQDKQHFSRMLLVDNEHQIAAWADHEGHVSCADFTSRTGFIRRISARTVEGDLKFVNKDVSRYQGTTYLDFCTTCTPKGRLGNILLSVLTFVIGVAICCIDPIMTKAEAD